MYRARSIPYGDVYQISTSAVDSMANRLYAEQRQRELEKRQADKALDDEFGKNVAGVKSADVPEITQAYNDFKQAHIALQKKGAKATPQDQMNVMIKKADAFAKIAASKEDKERLKNYVAEIKADKKGIYDPNAHNMVNTFLNTPTSKRNLDEDANLKYKYAMPNIDKELKNAATPPPKDAVKEIEIGVDPNDPLKDKVEVYSRMNPPNVFYNNLFTGLAARSDNKNFTRSVVDNITPEELEKLRVRYEAKINDPKFKAIYGEVKPFPESAGNTELGQAVAIKTMEVVDALPLQPIKSESRLNADRSRTRALDDWNAKFNANNREWDRRRPLKLADSLARIRANKAAGLPTDDTGYVSDEVALEFGKPETVRLNGKDREVTVVYTDDVDPVRMNLIAGKDLSKKQIGVKPIPIKQKDGSVKMGYYVDPGTGDWEGDKGQRISRERVKDDYIKSVSPTKFKTQVGTKGSENTKNQKTESKPEIVEQNGHRYKLNKKTGQYEPLN